MKDAFDANRRHLAPLYFMGTVPISWDPFSAMLLTIILLASPDRRGTRYPVSLAVFAWSVGDLRTCHFTRDHCGTILLQSLAFARFDPTL